MLLIKFIGILVILVQGCGVADIVFILDDSTSILERDFWVLKQFTIDVIKGLDTGAHESTTNVSRIGYVTYSDHAITQWQLGGKTNPNYFFNNFLIPRSFFNGVF